MEQFAVVIPDRGDRPEFTSFCFKQIERMSRLPDRIIHCSWPPIGESIDLVERVHHGVMMAQSYGIDVVFIIENDDYYPADYFERMGIFDADFFGDDLTFYYNLRNKSFTSFHHRNRSSLFVSGFRVSAVKDFQFSGDQFLDIKLWDHAIKENKKTKFFHSGAIGVKHGTGLCGGKGHKILMKNIDSNFAWLKGRVDHEAYEFYTQMSGKIRSGVLV